MLTLRPYQDRALAELWSWFERHPDGDPIIEASVGAGKSVMIAELCRRALEQAPGTRVLMVVHVKELLLQNLEKLLRMWPGAPVGLYSASVGKRQLGRDILYATIGSIHSKAHELGRVDICMVDECHLIIERDTTMYRRLIDELRRYNPAMRVVGWTGTAFRGDGVWLTQSGLFTHVAARVPMRELLDAGYLAPLVAQSTDTRISGEGVRVQNGDYAAKQLGERADKAELVAAACAELARRAAGRNKWLVFAVTVDHAAHVADCLRLTHGIACAVVSANTPPAERDQRIRDFRAGRLRALVNVAVLTTGFDVPEVDCIALLRPTKSPVLYVQIAGRGLRTAPGKADCLWLDFTDTTATLGPVDAIKGRAKPLPGNAPFKYCDDCGAVNTAAALACVQCGHLFPPPAEPDRVRHSTEAGLAEPMSGPAATELTQHEVSRVAYRWHEGRDGKPPTLRVDYYTGLRIAASEWVCIEHPHTSYPRNRAVQWWWQRGGSDAPGTVDEALQRTHELRAPVRLATRQAGKFTEVASVEFAEAATALAAA